jgi:hypothetical protein
MGFPVWSAPLVITLLLLACGLFMVGIWGIRLTVRPGRFQNDKEWRPHDYLQRLSLVESRLERLEKRTSSPSRDKAPSGSAPSVPSPMAKKKAPGQFASEGRRPGQQGGVTLIAIPDLAAVEPQTDKNDERALDLRHAEIWSMLDAGVPGDEIARRTGQPMGQVELIIGLYRQVSSGRNQVDNARTQ